MHVPTAQQASMPTSQGHRARAAGADYSSRPMSKTSTRVKITLKSMKRSTACLRWSSSPISYSSIIFCVSYAMYKVKRLGGIICIHYTVNKTN